MLSRSGEAARSRGANALDLNSRFCHEDNSDGNHRHRQTQQLRLHVGAAPVSHFGDVSRAIDYVLYEVIAWESRSGAPRARNTARRAASLP